ncbi:MAG: hypothetical protein RLZZ67_560 [Candidatus Parcubacteria bacterium]|jgi:hypothetical protein
MTSEPPRQEYRLSIKQFLINCFYSYPLWLFLILNFDYIKKNDWQKFEIFFILGTFILFSFINWILAQKILSKYLLILHVSVFVWLILSSPGSLVDVIIIYIGFSPIIFAYQVFTWMPFLIRFLCQNRHRLNKLPFD